MADDVPAALKQADINLYKTATRGAQLQTIKPIIAYWCEYWVVNQILAKGLHNSDSAILEYTTGLMDKLEQAKTDYANDPAIADDAAAQAYIEQFAQETLDRAERVVKANKVTANTATTFDAALTFLNLVNIWAPPDAETQQKIKYAKWNAARIIKAIKEGKDPNETNPKREEARTGPAPALDPNDPEVQMLGGAAFAQGPKPASVEDVPDAELPRSAGAVSPAPPVPDDGELKLPSAPGYGSQPGPQLDYFNAPAAPSPSSLSSPTHNPVTYRPADAAPSLGFDAAPSPVSLPGVASSVPFAPDAHRAPPSPPLGPPTFASTPRPTAAVTPPPISPLANPGFANGPPAANVSRPVAPPTAPPAGILPPPGGFSQVPQQVSGGFSTDDMAMAQAQKHAKWAISALNFEDVPTAVRELRRALEALGAS